MSTLTPIEEALEAFAAGQIVIVVDNEDRENEGDFIMLAEKATAEKVAFMNRYSTGLLCAPMNRERARTLGLPLMWAKNQDTNKTAFTVTTDAKKNLTTGVSATERATTFNELARANATADDFVRPGHVLPLIAADALLQERQGHTEAAVAMAVLVGAQPVGLLCEIVNDDGSMSRMPDLEKFAKAHALPIISIEALAAYARTKNIAAHVPSVPQLTWANLPLENGTWKISTFTNSAGIDHAIVALGDISGGTEVLMRVHSECLTGDVFSSKRCDCQAQLHHAMDRIADAGAGVIIYLRAHEGRGIGLAQKIKAYALQDQGQDTVQANISLGHESDERSFNDVTIIAKALGITSVRLLTNNPAKVSTLTDAGIKVSVEEISVGASDFNKKYLETKRTVMGHLIGKAK
jgi:3,4-dihydroxy 2-butanone 4-phosphate synthase / GTP cyclohydrolase II